MVQNDLLTGVERFFDDDDIIVSKTNLKGQITYANEVFLDISGYKENEILGKPHNIIRHPEMPRCVFKILWDTLGKGNEVFAYVNNRCKNGDFYWVYAHVTPSRNLNGELVGYHSNRRVPDKKILNDYIKPLYEKLKAEEEKHTSKKTGLYAAEQVFQDVLHEAGIAYDEFIATIGQGQRRGYR